MEIDELLENDERFTEEAEIKRDEMGPAFASLLGKVLPALQADESSGGLGPASPI